MEFWIFILCKVYLSFLVALIWSSSVQISELKFPRYISLPGRFVSMLVSYKTELPQSYLTAGWIYDNYDQTKTLFDVNSEKCSGTENLDKIYSCLQISLLKGESVKSEYYVVSNIGNRKKTWNEAAQLCRNISSHLPQFQSNEKLNDFVTLLKTSEEIPPLQAMYIGLRYSKVG